MPETPPQGISKQNLSAFALELSAVLGSPKLLLSLKPLPHSHRCHLAVFLRLDSLAHIAVSLLFPFQDLAYETS